jgi:hypothetical protein
MKENKPSLNGRLYEDSMIAVRRKLTQALRQRRSMASWNQQQSTSATEKIAVVTSSHEEFLRGKYNNDYYSDILKRRNVRLGLRKGSPGDESGWKRKNRRRAEVVDLEEECVCLLDLSCSGQEFRQRNDLSPQVNTILLTACYLHPNPEHPKPFFFLFHALGPMILM